jgi:uncharacterized protein YcbK (DUF882 family)
MTFEYFTYAEFDQPGLPGSGERYMSDEFIEMLDETREIYGKSIKINSGYRSKEYQQELAKRYNTGVAKNSPHTEGIAADIHVANSKDRWLLINSLLLAGFTRIGIASNFVHADISKSRSDLVIWHYKR